MTHISQTNTSPYWNYKKCRGKIFLKRNPFGWTVFFPAPSDDLEKWENRAIRQELYREEHFSHPGNPYISARSFAKVKAEEMCAAFAILDAKS